MLPKKLQKYLDQSQMKYEVIKHKTVYTAYDAAQTMHIKLRQIAKNLLVKFNKPFITGEKPYAIAVVPADKNIDLKKLTKTVSMHAVELNKKLRLRKPENKKKPILDIYNKVTKATIPKEKAMKEKLKIRPGAMTAFGSVYKLPTFIDKAVKGENVFSGGSFTESIKMEAKNFVQLEKSMSGNFSVSKKLKKIKIKKK